MDYKNHVSRRTRFHNWLKRKHQEADSIHLVDLSDSEEDTNDDDYGNEGFVPPVETGSCFLTDEFRVFVGTWNVAGRSPLGSLAVDLEDWLNLKSAADMYVLGFQEIVPLKAINVIGSEDAIPGEKWNSLIGKTLNDKYGCPSFTPLVHPISCNDDSNEDNQRSIIENRSHPTPSPMRGMAEEKHGYSKYKLMASKKMVGVFTSVWMKEDLLNKYCISNVKVCSVACGIMGYLGNKGSVSVSMSIEGTSFCFIVAHLASGEKMGDEVRRNYQVSEIFRRTSFPRVREDDDDYNPHPLTILGHDRIFWFGDLNYRLYLEDSLARKLIKEKDWRALQEFDQLRKELEYGGVFQGWREGNIEFAPTYKYSTSNCYSYSGGVPSKAGEKQRTPAWCDRILWYGKGVKQLSYYRSESKFSDHRPVSALFSTLIEVVKPTHPCLITLSTIFPDVILPTNNPRGEGKEEEEAKAEDEAKITLLSLLVEDMKASPFHNSLPITSLV